MFGRLRSLRTKWSEAGSGVYQLDAILGHAPNPKSTPRQKKEWLLEFLLWLFHQRLVGGDLRSQVNTRLRYLFMVLERNPEWQNRFTETVNSILLETSSVELFVGLGMSSEFTFFGEFFSRLSRKFFLAPPADHDFAQIFAVVFANKDERSEDILPIQPALFEQFTQTLGANAVAVDEVKNKLVKDARKALGILSVQYCGSSFSSALGQLRSREHQPDEPFLELLHDLDALFAQPNDKTRTAFENSLKGTELQLHFLSRRLQEIGVSLDVVYQLEMQENRLSRIKGLFQFVSGQRVPPEAVLQFMSQLVKDCSSVYSLRRLVSRSIRMMAKQIIQTNADVGDHYIAHTAKEFKSLFLRSCGGGLITTVTVVLKSWTHFIPSLFHAGLAAAVNYAGSFVAIYFAGFTLGTKQPAMTGAALAEKIGDHPSLGNLQSLKSEMKAIIRSQICSVIGNVVTVVPGVIAVDYLALLLHPDSRHFLSTVEAHHSLQSVSLLGPSPLYAAFTGVILWASSVVAGWANNWFILRDQFEAIKNNRRLRNMLGPHRAEKVASFWRRHIAGIVGNTALGFGLGLTPVIFTFVGIPLDVRHVTLMSGQIGLALPALGWNVFSTTEFWLAMAGMLAIGLLNISVSFGLALWVAVRSKGLAPSVRWRLYWKLPSFRLLLPWL